MVRNLGEGPRHSLQRCYVAQTVEPDERSLRLSQAADRRLKVEITSGVAPTRLRSSKKHGKMPPRRVPQPCSMDQADATFKFGRYELRPGARELHKNGVKVRLRLQPFQVLQLLLEHAGKVVTREELRGKLWPSDTFVDFEHGLNTAVKELRAALSDSAAEPRYVQTLPRVGYRMIVPVSVQTPAAVPVAAPSRDAVEERVISETVSRFRILLVAVLRHRRVLAGAAVILIVGLGVYVRWSRLRARAGAPSQRSMLAVLPFENLTGDASQEYFSDGLTEEMITRLGNFDPRRLGVIARTSVMHYKNGSPPLEQIGRELGVQYVIEGSVRRDANHVRISAQLIEARDQTHLWAREYDRDLKDVLALQSEVAREIADEIQLTLGDRKTATTAAQASLTRQQYEAYDLYLKGRYFWNKRTSEGFQQAMEYFQQAIAKDPSYAPAHAGLADTFGLMSNWGLVPRNEFMPKARSAALRGLQIDEGVAEAHASLALIAESYDYDWQTAEREFKRAIQLDPGYATAHQWYAEYLSWQGRFEEAFAESDRARQLDPLSLIIATDHAAILYFSRQYDRAVAQCRTVLDRDPSFPRTGGILLVSYAQEGRFVEALADVEKLRHSNGEGWYWSSLAYVYGRTGQQAQARHALGKLERLVRHTPLAPSWTQALVEAYLGVGRKEEAIALLQKAYAQHSSLLTILKVEPIYDPLRSDQRFQDLLRRVGLAQ